MVDTLSYPVTGDHHLSDGWEDHISRGSLGGVDFPVAYGTPVYATHDGFLSVDPSSSGSGGRVATIQGGGITDQMLHMSSFTRGNGNVSRGEHIGYSGASAYGSDYGTGGPHVHWHAIVNGIRVNPLLYVDGSSPAGGGNSTPISGDDVEMLSPEAQDWLTRTVRDQLGAAIRDQILPAIEHSRTDAVGRQDQKIIPVLNDIQSKVNAGFPTTTEAAKNAGRRDARNVRIYSQDFGPDVVAVDWHTGTVEDFNNLEELAFAVKVQAVSAASPAPGQPIAAEPPVKLNKTDWARMIKVANQRKARTQETAEQQAARLNK